MLNILCIALGGALGALLRYSVTVFCVRFEFTYLPFATLFVNLVGSFFVGFGASIFLLHNIQETYLSNFMFIGLLGAFTTFSTFAYDSFLLWQNGQKVRSLFFVLLNIIGGICLVFLGVLAPFNLL